MEIVHFLKPQAQQNIFGLQPIHAHLHNSRWHEQGISLKFKAWEIDILSKIFLLPQQINCKDRIHVYIKESVLHRQMLNNIAFNIRVEGIRP